MSRQLAVLGGKPAFDEPLHVGRPNIGDRSAFLDRVGHMLDSRWLTNDGPMVRELEEAIANRLGVSDCVAMCNGTVALEIASRALGMSGQVIVPAFTFVATAHALQWQEISPVLCDVEPANHGLDPTRVEEMITPRTTGILATHLWGFPCEAEALQEIADRHGLRLLFDAAHAFDCSIGARMVGSFGHAEVFSFHATKFFNTFEGGAVVTDDSDLAARMRLMRNFGFSGVDSVVYVGTNGKMHEASAAIGLTNLEAIDGFITANVENYAAYRTCLGATPGLRLLAPDREGRWNHQYVVVEVHEERAGLSRDALVSVLQAENVLARRYFTPGVHKMEPYRSHQPHAGLLLPVTERLAGDVMVLPTGTAVEPKDAELIGEIITDALTNASVIRSSLAAR